MLCLYKSTPKDRSFIIIAWLLLFKGFSYTILHTEYLVDPVVGVNSGGDG